MVNAPDGSHRWGYKSVVLRFLLVRWLETHRFLTPPEYCLFFKLPLYWRCSASHLHIFLMPSHMQLYRSPGSFKHPRALTLFPDISSMYASTYRNAAMDLTILREIISPLITYNALTATYMCRCITAEPEHVNTNNVSATPLMACLLSLPTPMRSCSWSTDQP